MAKQVKGVVLLDYVRMIKRFKDIDWDKYLIAADKQYLEEMIIPAKWYPYETYVRMGDGIFHEVAKGNVELVRMWGRTMVDQFHNASKLVDDSDGPPEAIEKIYVLYDRYFDFKAVEMQLLDGNRLKVDMNDQWGDIAIEAYTFQFLGLVERIIELSGAKNIKTRFLKKYWEGDEKTEFELEWES